MKYISYLLLLVTISCSEDDPKFNRESNISMSQDQARLDNASEPGTSDPFRINAVSIEGMSLFVEVSYGGGCQTHDFELIWPEVITLIFPPDFGVLLTHDANGDNCEAYLTDTLVFDLSDNPLNLSSDAISQMKISVINDSDNTNVVSNR